MVVMDRFKLQVSLLSHALRRVHLPARPLVVDAALLCCVGWTSQKSCFRHIPLDYT